MAFGDFCSNIGLPENAGCSFAMVNSHPEVLKKGCFLAGSSEYGVTAAIRRSVLNGEPIPEENPLFEP